ncbi:hypothetical protein DL96DRAFT_1625861 [Flagelloscypha sp. PMI_526]|nr:hypothetical protein DL96DRAFT_1625861 [Flagelloscypha sp. PMI_526]
MPKVVVIPDDIGVRVSLFAFLLNYSLLGALVVQVYNYNAHYSRGDPRWLKGLVYLIFAFELAQSGLMGNDADPDINHTDWLSVCILGSLVAGPASNVQGYYAYRLWIFSRSYLVTSAIVSLSVVQTVTGVIQGIKSKLVVRFSKLQNDPRNLAVWIFSAAACDLLIAVCMEIDPSHVAISDGTNWFVRTDRVISKLATFAIETGLVTALMALSFVILFMAVDGKDYFEGLAKVYSNQLMVVLNSRQRVKAIMSEGSEHSLSSVQGIHQITTTQTLGREIRVEFGAPPPPCAVTIQKEVWRETV